MPRLTIQERGREAKWSHECTSDTISIGRMDDNTVQLKSDGVSRRHAKIMSDGGNFFLMDLGSGNGTLLNGIQIKSNEKTLLQLGDVISIDVFNLKFHADKDITKIGTEDEVTDSDILEVKLLKKVLGALDKETLPTLEVLNGSAEGKKFLFTDEISDIVIGRDPECDFAINEYVISRRHARVVKKWGGIIIRDLESKNGTFINNRRVVEEYLHDGDRISLGTIVLMFRNPQEINVAALGEIKPKHRPAPVSPQEIPGLEGVGEAVEVRKAKAPPKPPPPEEEGESAAIEEWDKLEKSLSGIRQYPTPTPRASMFSAIKRLTPVEIGMIGLGGLVLIFALITIVNLIFA